MGLASGGIAFCYIGYYLLYVYSRRSIDVILGVIRMLSNKYF